MTAKLEVSGLSYSYHSMDGETQALSNISFTVDTGEFIAIVGPSGCGKSTLLSIFSGLLKPDEGEILIDGIPLPDSKVNIGYTPKGSPVRMAVNPFQRSSRTGNSAQDG